MYKCFPLLLILVFTLLLAACQVGPAATPETPAGIQAGNVEVIVLPDGNSLYFPRQPVSDGAVMEALAEGPLSLVEGCLRIGMPDDADPGFLVLWPALSSLRVTDSGVIEVLDRNGQSVGRVGERMRLGGGAMESQEAMNRWDEMIAGLPIAGCPGPYWIAGALYPLAAVEPDEPKADVVRLGTPWADFSLRFDPTQWDITAFRDDMPDLQSLTHQTLAGGCRITPNIPVGLGEDWMTEDGQVTLGQLALQTRKFYQNGELKFVAYYGFLGSNQEGAVEVHFEDNAEACLQAAEALFATTQVTLPTPGVEPTQSVSIAINEWPGELYQTVFSIPVGEGGIQYRGAGVPEMQVTGPNALAVLADGTFLIADPVDNRVLHYDSGGGLIGAMDLSALGIANVSDIKAAGSEFYLLEISFNVAPERYRVSHLSFVAGLIAQYDIPAGYRFEDGLWGLAVGSQGELLLELGGDIHRYYQLADPTGAYTGDTAGLPAYGRLYQVNFAHSTGGLASISAGDLYVESKGTVGDALLRLLAVNPDGSLYVIREDMVDDFPVILGDVTVHYLDPHGEQQGVARFPLAEWYYPIWPNFLALGPDGNVYALLPRADTVDILRLNFYHRLDPLIPEAEEPLVRSSGTE